MLKKIIFISILLFPFQNLSVFLMGSRYDLTAFLLLSVAFYSLISLGISKQRLLYVYSFILIQTIIFAVLNIAPYYRFISGLIWLGGLIVFLLLGEKIKYNQSVAFHSIVFILSITSIYIYFEFFYLGQIRPSAWFHEPSFAGLSMYSASAGLLISIFTVRLTARIKIILILIFLCLFGASILTYSMHFVTFLISISLFFSYLLLYKTNKFSTKRIFILVIIGVLLYLVGSNLFLLEHYTSRLNIDNPTNLSLLAWLQGFDQMVASIEKSPVFGLGLGSTGFFNFKSGYSDILRSVGLGMLTLTDTFSLAFRLVVEIGLFFSLLFVYFLLKRLIAFKRFVNISGNLSSSFSLPIIFNFVFAFSVILGCLLKEPLYPQSYLYLSIFLISSIPIKYKPANSDG